MKQHQQVEQKVLNAIRLILLLLILCNCKANNTSGENSSILSSSPNVIDDYNIIIEYFKNMDNVKLRYNTTNIYLDLSILKKLENWNQENYNLGNINHQKINFETLFSQDELLNHINSFKQIKRTRLKQNLLSDNIILEKKANQVISFPYIFKSKKNRHFALMYSEVFNGIENGAGGVYLFEKNNNKDWKLIFSFNLWIS